MASFKISIFLMMTSVIIHVQAHGLRRQKKYENNYSGFEHGTTKVSQTCVILPVSIGLYVRLSDCLCACLFI